MHWDDELLSEVDCLSVRTYRSDIADYCKSKSAGKVYLQRKTML